MLDGEIRQASREFSRVLVQGTQVRALHFVAAFHLPHQKFGIAAHQQAIDSLRYRIVQRADQRVVFGHIIGRPADVFSGLETRGAIGTADNHGVRRGTGISARSSIHIGDENVRGFFGQSVEAGPGFPREAPSTLATKTFAGLSGAAKSSLPEEGFGGRIIGIEPRAAQVSFEDIPAALALDSASGDGAAGGSM